MNPVLNKPKPQPPAPPAEAAPTGKAEEAANNTAPTTGGEKMETE